MKRSKIKKLKVPIQDEGLAEMFNQMLGTGTINTAIAYPRYLRIKVICQSLIRLFGELTMSPFMRAMTEFAEHKKEIERFCVLGNESIRTLFSVDLSKYELNLNDTPDQLKTLFSESYENVRKSALINTFILLCDRLVKYKNNFIDLSNLNYKFITTMPGVEWCPFPFTGLNLKHIFSLGNVGENTIRFFMIILNKSFELTHKLYEELQSPDIDTDKFIDVIMSNIDLLQKRPELNRCRNAFKKIKESVDLLKDRFNDYYRDFVATKDSTIMMQHFILDVSKNTNADPRVTAEFRLIIQYYRKVAQESITDPKVKMLFDRVNQSFTDMERGTENLVNVRGENNPVHNTTIINHMDNINDTTGSTDTDNISASALSLEDLYEQYFTNNDVCEDN